MNEFEGLFASKSNSKIGVEIPKAKYLNDLNPLPQVEPWLAQAIELYVENSKKIQIKSNYFFNIIYLLFLFIFIYIYLFYFNYFLFI